MGKRKRSKNAKGPETARRLGSLWPEDVVKELLAFLDYAKMIWTPTNQIDQEIAQHLTIWSDNGDYGPEQIRRKLHRLRYDYGPEDDTTKDMDRIYIEGSDNLTWFNEGQKEEIARRTTNIAKERELEDIYSPRKLRSGSLQVLQSPGPSKRTRSESRSTIEYQRPARSTFTPSTHPLRHGLVPDSFEEVSDIAACRSNTDVSHKASLSNADSDELQLKVETDSPMPGTPRGNANFTLEIPETRLHAERVEANSNAIDNPGSKSDCFQSVGTDLHEDDQERRVTPPSQAVRSMKDRIVCLENDLENLRRHSAMDVDFWKARCVNIELKCAEFQRSQESLAVRLGQMLKADGRADAGGIIELQATVDRLELELADRNNVARLTRRSARSLDNATALWVERHVAEMLKDVQEIFTEELEDAGIEWELLDIKPGSLLVQLVGRISPEHARAVSDMAHGIGLLRLHGATDLQLLCSLSAAALIEWVFRPSAANLFIDRYEGFCSAGTTSAYAKALAFIASRDPAFARNIDVEICRSIQDDAGFQHFVDIKATDLGVKLQTALSTLWARSSISEVASEASDAGASLGDKLARVFSKAIDVQCRLRVSGRQFQCTWYAPGQTVDQEYMALWGSSQGKAEGPSRVSLTLWPGINEILDETPGLDVSGFVDGCSGSQAHSRLIRAIIL